MWGIEMNSNDSETKGLAQLNPHQKESRDRVGGGDGQGIPEEDEWRISENGENVNGVFVELVQAEAVPRRQQQQPQRTVVQWDQFLPLRSLKVLLVENNDSTRHVVGALLRNCGYEVVAVTNGIEAWKILEDRTDHIDLVLTEVVMPCLSGVGLLSKIKRHTISKHIPVIMMSSNDSMGTVINCLSKGAVDFLVKPIRKNEIKNLWQHVWRKCRSSSGSESGTRTQNPTISKGVEGLENNTSCNNENDNGSVGLNFKDESDNGSATQSSWSKRVVEVDWHQQMSVSDQLVDRLVSTCAQVIHSRPEAISSNWVPKSATRECCREDELDCVAMGKDLEIGIPRSPDLQLEDPSKKVLKSVIDTNTDNFFDLHSKNGGKELEKERLELDSETVNGKRRKKAANFTLDDITNCTNHQMESVADEVPNDPSKISNTEDRAINVTNELSSLELRLKRQRVEEDATIGTQERNVLRHSDLSAFTRYNASIDNQDPAGNIGSCYPLYNNSEAANGKLIHNLQFKLHTTPNPNQCSNVSSSKDNMGSTSDYVFNKPEASNEMPIPASTVKADGPDTTTGNTVSAQAKAMHQQVQVQHHHHYYHHHHHHVHNSPKQQEPSNHEDLSLRNTVASASNCRPSNVLTGLSEGNAANYTSYSLSGSGSGSINKSNGEDGSRGQNGSSSSAAMAGGVNTVRNDGVGGNCGGEDGSGSGGGVDQNRLAQREAALYKFRQKRRDRCFDKKVRYQNRKRVAEQRPRVRGQFARQFHFS